MFFFLLYHQWMEVWSPTQYLLFFVVTKLLGKRSCSVGKPVYSPFEWCHICKELVLVGWAAELSVWAVPMKICQVFSASAALHPQTNMFWWRQGDGVGQHLPQWKKWGLSTTAFLFLQTGTSCLVLGEKIWQIFHGCNLSLHMWHHSKEGK